MFSEAFATFTRRLIFTYVHCNYVEFLMQSLSIEASAEEIKTFCAKTSFDFLAKSLNFVRKSDVTNVFLLLNVEDSPIPHHGYRLPNSTSSPDANNQLKEVGCIESAEDSLTFLGHILFVEGWFIFLGNFWYCWSKDKLFDWWKKGMLSQDDGISDIAQYVSGTHRREKNFCVALIKMLISSKLFV